MDELDLTFVELNKKGSIQREIRRANTNTTEEYKRTTQNKERKNYKKEIKGFKLFDKYKKHIAVAMLVAGVGTGYAMSKVPEYKEAQAKRILNVVKTELGAEKIWNNSTNLGSGSGKIEFVVKKDGRTYKHAGMIDGGGDYTPQKEELNKETVNAIEIASNAQGGSLMDAIIADRYADKIEKGKINLTIDEKVKENIDEGR